MKSVGPNVYKVNMEGNDPKYLEVGEVKEGNKKYI